MGRTLPFAKMHGAGNDFVMLDGRHLQEAGVVLDRRAIARLCHRQKGIGADGLIIVAPDDDLAFGMIYFNSDGGEADMCGNGARCTFAFARAAGLCGDAAEFSTAVGRLQGAVAGNDVTVSLPPPRNIKLDTAPLAETPFARVHHADTGVPHLVIPVDQLEAVDVPRWGPILRNDAAFAPAGANVNWVQRRDDGLWLIRTYERGVEAETLACGTGASAAALILARLGEAAPPVTLLTRGGDRLTIGVEDPAGSPRLTLTGPAVTAFRGEVDIDD
ncbi:diaminopimelate epimerase [bacterium]|mgnify:CR=1 FL=1|nr:diaminopimelate epimerase [bacterium]HPF33979.1 diaminopimelate epimerase [Candidatus Krumholzibacteria bacterium]HRX52034.1 diaminopimelate epimerase [Candidatus Krumholzibacteria bacterium]